MTNHDAECNATRKNAQDSKNEQDVTKYDTKKAIAGLVHSRYGRLLEKVGGNRKAGGR